MSGRQAGAAARALVGVGTALTILGVSVAVLLNPIYIHAALDASGSAAILGMTRQATHAVSDRTIGELVFGPATFAFSAVAGGPRFYDVAEASHLHDASNLLHVFLAVTGLGLVVLLAILVPRRRDPDAWRAVQAGTAGLAGLIAAVGVFFAVAFDAAFTLFHEIFFPQGNWSFNPATERMVQLYPTPFWELISMTLALVVLVLCVVAWLVARARVRALEWSAEERGEFRPGIGSDPGGTADESAVRAARAPDPGAAADAAPAGPAPR